MVTTFVFRNGVAEEVSAVDPAWLAPGATEVLWVDLESPDEVERKLLTETFHFHELAVEDAIQETHHPKIEQYGGMLYLILHGIVAGKKNHGFVTNDVDFFLGRNYLVTVHFHPSRSIVGEREVLKRHGALLGEGSCSLLHRLVDRMVDHYNPEVDALEDRLEALEQVVFSNAKKNPLRKILGLKADIASLRRVTLPQRDAVMRLSRREFSEIPEQLAYRFRDVYDHLVRLADEAVFLQDRVTGLLDAYLSTQSNRLNQVMKVLTVIATIFMPLTVLTGMYGMNVELPHLPGGGPTQFWWVLGIMLVTSGVMLWFFRRNDWL
ncbi:MAG TPA: magnesium/cobalt transporter CorA [Vicinamibacterales bacterium]|nr:magnesium/cobalt transporter CorA [Vicinamibacterales bacterium]